MTTPTIVLDSTTFSKYDALAAEANSLTGIEVHVSNATSTLNQQTKDLQATRTQLSGCRSRIVHHKDKLAKCEGGGFFSSHTILSPTTWFKGGVPARIISQKKKLADRQQEESTLLQAEAQKVKQTADARAALDSATNVKARKDALDAEALSLYEGVVQAQATPALVALRQQRATWEQSVAFETTNAALLEKVQALCDRARSQYASAAQALRAANATNTGAKITNTIQMFENEEERRRHELAERMQQQARNRQMRSAAQAVQSGGSLLSQAMSAIPVVAQQRYPQVCVGLGQVHLPSVELCGTGEFMLEAFGGNVGDMIANQQAQAKINRSIGSIEQCAAIVDQQRALVSALLQALRTDGANAAANLTATLAQEKQEKDNIWNATRAHFCGGAVAMPMMAQAVASPANTAPMAQAILAPAEAVPMGGHAQPPVAVEADGKAVGASPAVATAMAMPVGRQDSLGAAAA